MKFSRSWRLFLALTVMAFANCGTVRAFDEYISDYGKWTAFDKFPAIHWLLAEFGSRDTGVDHFMYLCNTSN